MPSDVTMPKLTDSMEEGRIVEWKVDVGDRVSEGDVLAEIETDKAVMELESFWDGELVELLRGDGDVVAVGEVVARVAAAGERPAEKVEMAESPEAVEAVEAAEAPEQPGEPEESEGPEKPEEAEEAEETKEEVEKGKIAPPGPAAGASADVPIPGGHPLSERGGVASPRPERPLRPAAAPEGPRKGAGVRASPRARRRALELNLDLGAVTPTGGDGQVTVEDVEAHAKGGGDKPRARSGPPSVSSPDRADEELPPVSFDPAEAEVEDVTFYQKAAIRRVVASKHVIPHFYVTKAVRAEQLLARRGTEKETIGASLTHYILQACARALVAFPEANRSYDRGRWIRWKVVHLGLAVQTDAGLVVAVLRRAQDRDISWLAEQTRNLVERARAGKLTGPERSNPTFTISNLGAYDVESFAAIINPPSALTLAVGSVVDVPVVEGGQVVPGKVLHLTLSCDHRVVDGVLAARFLGEVKRLLENPGEL